MICLRIFALRRSDSLAEIVRVEFAPLVHANERALSIPEGRTDRSRSRSARAYQAGR